MFKEITIAGLREAYASGTRCTDVIRWHLDRLEAADPVLHCIQALVPGAMDQARELEAAAEPVGPLHGVPVVVKDNIEVAGLPTTGGSAALADLIATEDAQVVVQLRRAGAIVLAKTTMTELAWGMWDTQGSAFDGPTCNPYDPAYACGGSSGGSAVAVSANLAVAAIGSDTGCSVRAPASICGIVGLRPTLGGISTAGLLPMTADWDTVGPMARRVADVRELLRVLATGELEGRPATLQVGVPRQLIPADDVDPEVASAFEAALDALRSAGFVVVDPVPMDELPPFEFFSWYRRMRHDLEAWLRSRGGPDLVEMRASGKVHPRYQGLVNDLIEHCVPPDEDSERPAMFELKSRIQQVVLAAMEGLDTLVFPTFRHPPVRNGDVESPRGNALMWAPECSFPAVSVPMGFSSDGLPLGLQWLGRPGDELRLLGVAERFEAATQHRQPPRA